MTAALIVPALGYLAAFLLGVVVASVVVVASGRREQVARRVLAVDRPHRAAEAGGRPAASRSREQ